MDTFRPAAVTPPTSGLGPIVQVGAGELDIGLADLGPTDGPAILLLHGWPYDINSYTEVARMLAEAGFRVLVPHLRGYGTTRFRSAGSLRAGGGLGLADGASEYDDLERRLAERPPISVPTITLEGDANGAPHPDAASYRSQFVGQYEHRVVTGVGHNLPQEAPRAFADAVIDVDRSAERPQPDLED